jgi:hypothetical protein
MAVAVVACLSCHPRIVQSYLTTGMGRSFFPLTAATRVEDFTNRNSLLHTPSKSRFTMTMRDGRFFLKREHPNGTREVELHYVLGSGNHARSYVSRTAQGRLLAMPVSWYAENGGYWQMAPGYDRPDHADLRRKIDTSCFFCHNGYPEIADNNPIDPRYRDPLPQGIDCTRCHGPAEAHLRKPGRGTILNPKHLPAARQLDICMQCHLQTTSQPLPAAIRRFERGPFSYQPGEPLGDFQFAFDHPRETPQAEKFEVVNAAYRLRQSACFVKSAGSMTCTTCHNPHGRDTKNACAGCHPMAHQREADRRNQDCAGCHMAKRRPEDARHTTLTDHRIARKPTRADGQEFPPYRGAVAPYYPSDVPPLYRAVAQVRHGADLTRGIQALREQQAQFPRAEFQVELGDAYRLAGRSTEAMAAYRGALEREPKLLAAWHGLGLLGYPALQPLLEGLKHFPGNSFLLTLLGTARSNAADLRAAIEADPDLPEAYVNLGALLARSGRREEAIALFRKALEIDPTNRAAEGNLRLALAAPGTR